MKKIISAVSALIAVSVISSDIYAAEIKINKAEKTDTGAVSVECIVTDPCPYQEFTVISREENTDDYSKALIYIDQYSKEMSTDNNTFSFEFTPASWADLTQNDKVYIVRVGGSSVEKPAEMVIASIGGEVVYAIGDINGDKKVDRADAILLLKHTSNIISLTQPQIDAGDVNNDNNVDILDVTEILSSIAEDTTAAM